MLLLDNSAWSLLQRRPPGLDVERLSWVADLLRTRQLAVTLPFLLEAGYSARGGADHAALMSRLLAQPRVLVDDLVESAALDAQRALAERGRHRLPPPDLIIAAAAARHGHGVLHYDRDFDTIAELTPLVFESVWIVPRGTA